MNFIKSESITSKLTHVTSLKDYKSMIKNSIKIKELSVEQLSANKPPGFWISINNEWEKWCESHEFSTTDASVICDVKLKPDLKFLKITTLDDARNLLQFLMPQLKLTGSYEDFFKIMIYQMENLTTPRIFWKKVLDNYDGVYFKNSNELHLESRIFYGWDADCIVVFDPMNVKLKLE